MKHIFSYNADIEKNAYLNWRTHKHEHVRNMIVIADGFMSSSILLTEQTIKDNVDKKADKLIFPILFNINHGIEVYLKAISWSLNTLNNKNTKDYFRKSHQLNSLLNDVKSLVNEFEYDTDKLQTFENMILPLENYINELYSLETIKNNGKKQSDITFPRYPLTFDDSPQFYINEYNNVVVDLENFLIVFNEIHKSLDRIASHYLYDFEEA